MLAYREICFRYDSDTREMRVTYDPSGKSGCRKQITVKTWCGHATFFVDEGKTVGYPKWLIAVTVHGTPPDDLAVTYDLVDIDLFSPAAS